MFDKGRCKRLLRKFNLNIFYQNSTIRPAIEKNHNRPCFLRGWTKEVGVRSELLSTLVRADVLIEKLYMSINSVRAWYVS